MTSTTARRALSTLLVAISLTPQFAIGATNCDVLDEESFAGETVRKVRGHGLGSDDAFGLFSAVMHVNTDGAPTSYHPLDEKGEKGAINRVDNGVSIYVRATNTKLRGVEYFAVYELWRDAGFPKRLNDTYRINWENVLAPTGPGGGPCIFRSGDYQGYFGSLTALKNGLPKAASGECLVANQLDQRYVPAIVLRGGDNPLKGYGADIGDLVIAINPATNVIVPAVIGDSGDGDQIGEGSVALNMALLGKTEVPTTYKEAKALDTGPQQMIIAVLPGTVRYARVRPYTRDNIAARVSAWVEEHDYQTLASFADIAKTCAQGL